MNKGSEKEKKALIAFRHAIFSNLFIIYLFIKNSISIYILRTNTEKISSQFNVLKDHFSLSLRLCNPC